MSDRSKDSRTKTELLDEIQRLQFRLQEAEETLEAIRHAEVDALVVAGPQGERVFSITGAEHIYRVIVETMNEAALTVDPDGTILFCNQRFCDLMKTPIQEAMGRKVMAFVARPQRAPLKTFLADAQGSPVQRRLTLRAADGAAVPVQLAASPLRTGDHVSICLVASDLTELEASAHSIRVLREHQQALEESEARFRTMFETSQDAIVITDDAGVYVQANPAVAALFGLPPDQLLDRKVSEFLDDTLDFPAFWQDFLINGSFHGELGLIDAQRQRREVDCYAVTNILPGRHMAVVRDITERKRAQRALEEMNERLQMQAEELEGQTEELRVQTEELAAANAALRQSEERLRLAQQAGRVGVFDRDLQNNTAFWTPELEELFGIPAGAFEGKPEDWAKRVYPEDLPRMRSFLEEWIQSARTEETWQYRFIREDGQVRWMEGRGRIFRDPNGKPLRMIGTNTDITERKQAEEALRESEERYRTLFESSRDGIIFTDMEGQVLHTNPYFQGMLGYTPEELRALTYQQLTPRRWQEMEAAIVRDQVATRGYSGEYEKEYIRKDRTVFPVSIQVWLIRDGDGRPQGMWGIVRDITERKRGEEALRKSEEKFAKAFRSSPIAIAVTRRSDGQIVEVNEAMLKLLHFNRDELIDRTTLDLGIWVDVNDRAALMQRLATAGSVRDLEYRLRTKDGAIVTIRLSAEVLDFSGEPCMLSTLVDVTEQKEAEEALRQSEERLKRTQGIAHLGSWELDLVNNRLSWSDEVYRIFGLVPQEFKATYGAFLETVHSDDRAAVDAAYSGSLREGRDTYEIEHRIIRRSTGEIRIVHEKCEHVRDASDRIVRSVGMVHDITERKQAEDALRKSEYLRRLAQEITSVGTFEWNIVTGVNTWTPELEELYGLPPGGFAGTQPDWEQLVHPEDRAHAVAAVTRAFDTSETVEDEWRVIWPDGSIHWLAGRFRILRDQAGKPLVLTGVNIDITERKRAEDALRKSEEQFHRLFDEDLTGDFVSTPEGQILLCNPAFARIFGFSTVQEAVGTNLLDLYLDPQERAALLARLRQQKKIERLEVWRQRRDGQKIYIVENLVGHFNERGELDEIRGYLFDDTERKRAEEALRGFNATLEGKVAQRTAELQHRARQLQKLTLELSETEDRERRQLAEVLHDDLQQQLAAAKFHLSLLSSRAKHDPAQLAVVAQVDQMLMEAIQKSRNLSHELSPAVLYHADLAGALSWLAGQLRAKHGLEVAVDAFGEVNVRSEALKTFLYKSAQELLFNVVKHARVNQARVRVRRLGRCICLSVSDRGRGFDPQELRQAAGFGLFSIRERIELLGGRMKIHSAKGQGSTFHIVIPDGPLVEDGYPGIAGVGPGARPMPGTRPDGHEGPPLRVLLADDHEIVREGLRSLLSDEHDVRVVGEAANGREAVDQAYRLQPDVVIMDVAMPLINGDDATRQIKRHLPRTRVIALSMYEEPDMVEKMRRAGAEGYILKTAPSDELLTAIRGKPTPA